MAIIQWFPGHMAKTINELKETIKVCDMVIEVCDARIVRSSRNPILDEIIGDRRRIVVLNKKDLADSSINHAWINYFQAHNTEAMLLDARSRNDAKALENRIVALTQDILDKAQARGRITRPIRLLVAGIPNSGKSTLINTLIGKKKAQTANKPGVTRQLQWLKLGSKLQLLDSPGLLWPKLESRHEQIALGACAAVKDDIMPREELASELLFLLCTLYPKMMKDKFGLQMEKERRHSDEELGRLFLEHIAITHGLVHQEGKVDWDRAAQFILKQFRDGNLGKTSLEWPENDDLL